MPQAAVIGHEVAFLVGFTGRERAAVEETLSFALEAQLERA